MTYQVKLDTAKVKAIREDKGLSQEQAATAAGMSRRQDWHQVESSDGNVKLDMLAKIATALGTNPTKLLEIVKTT